MDVIQVVMVYAILAILSYFFFTGIMEVGKEKRLTSIEQAGLIVLGPIILALLLLVCIVVLALGMAYNFAWWWPPRDEK